MISFWISVVPPKIARTGLWVGRLSRRPRVLAVHNEDLAGDQVAVRGSPRQIPRRKAGLLWWERP
jgi:hypothetical protein